MSVLSVGGLSASFLGGLAIRDAAEISRFTWGGVFAFVVLSTLCVGVLWPRTFRTTQDPVVLIRWVDTAGADADYQSRELARHMASQYEENSVTLSKLMKLYCIAVVALLVQVSCLILDLVGR